MMRLAGLLLALLLAGCGEDIVLPEAQPLSVARSDLQALPGGSTGPHQVTVDRELALTIAAGRSLAINAYYPSQGGPFPLLLFSHGNWSDRHSYDRLIEHWVSHGYTVLATDHADCCGAPRGIFNALRYGQKAMIDRRVEDLQGLLDGVPDLERRYPGFAGKADTSRVAATGHSFGAFSAQQLGGASAQDPDSGSYDYRVDPRIRAVVGVSPPGPMFDLITADSWRGLKLPTLATTGTWDMQKGFFPDWRLHLMAVENAPPEDKYTLVIEGADHYLGNLICRTQREQPPQHNALLALQIATTSFLDAYLKDAAPAHALLVEDQLGQVSAGFARIGAL